MAGEFATMTHIISNSMMPGSVISRFPFKITFPVIIRDQTLFHFFPDGFFQTGNSPDIPYRIDTVNQDLPGRCNIKIS